MSKNFRRIEKGVSIVIGKPLTWLSFLIWIMSLWTFGQTCRFGSWLRLWFTKHKGSTKRTSRGKPSVSPS